MLHELLLALNGYTGGIFRQGEDGKIKVVPDLPFLHQAECAMLNRMCQLATNYVKLKDFIEDNSSHRSNRERGEGAQPGLYLQALAQGLSHVLSPYQQLLVQLEKELLADANLTAAHVQAMLEEYQSLLPALVGLLEQIYNMKAHGCQVLEIVYKASSNGVPLIHQTMLRLLHQCHQVLFKQLSSLLLHGLLLDPYGELFVQEATSSGGGTSQEPQEEEEDLGIGGLSGKQMRELLNLEGAPAKFSSNRFCIRADLLPFYISSPVAQKILFIGESVNLFQRDRQGTSALYGGLFREHEHIFAKKLQQMALQPELDIREFETLIGDIRTVAAEKMLKLVVEEGNLQYHLGTLKDFFLMGRGELFVAFIDQARTQLGSQPTVTTEYDINMAMQLAARNVLLEDESLLQKFHLKLDAKKGTKQSEQSGSTIDICWNLLNMTYKVEWPLHTLLTQSVLDRYNTLFRFLLAVKRVQLQLQKCWMLRMKEKLSAPASTSKWLLRNHMAFLIDNLQYYLQADVIESQFSLLINKIQTTKDFEQICLAHEQFVSSLLAQSFLHMKPISKCLIDILNLCLRFCTLVETSGVNIDTKDEAALADVQKDFERQSGLLFMILSNVRSHQSSPYLAQFLLRVDYNKYFSNAGGQLGAVGEI